MSTRFHPTVLAEARGLLDGHEAGTNPEYERALVEVLLRTAHSAHTGSDEARREAKEALGLMRWRTIWIESWVSFTGALDTEASASGYDWFPSKEQAVESMLSTIEAYSDQSMRGWVRWTKVPDDLTGVDVTHFINAEIDPYEGEDSGISHTFTYDHTVA